MDPVLGFICRDASQKKEGNQLTCRTAELGPGERGLRGSQRAQGMGAQGLREVAGLHQRLHQVIHNALALPDVRGIAVQAGVQDENHLAAEIQQEPWCRQEDSLSPRLAVHGARS